MSKPRRFDKTLPDIKVAPDGRERRSVVARLYLWLYPLGWLSVRFMKLWLLTAAPVPRSVVRSEQETKKHSVVGCFRKRHAAAIAARWRFLPVLAQCSNTYLLAASARPSCPLRLYKCYALTSFRIKLKLLISRLLVCVYHCRTSEKIHVPRRRHQSQPETIPIR